MATVQPVPLAEWAIKVERLYTRKRPSTRYRMSQAIREAIALAGPQPTTSALTADLVEQMSHRLGASATTHGLMRALRTACRLAVRWGWLVAAPFDRDTPWPEPDAFTPWRHHAKAKIAQFLAHLNERSGTWQGRRIHALAAVWAYTGVRRNEALRLRREDVLLDRSILIVRRPPSGKLKTRGSAAAVPMPAALTAILAAWLPHTDPDWVFPGVKRRGPWTGGKGSQRAGCKLRIEGESIGISGLTPHSLRRSLATHLRGSHGLTREQLRMILRHSNAFTQDLYVGEDLDNLAALVKTFVY